MHVGVFMYSKWCIACVMSNVCALFFISSIDDHFIYVELWTSIMLLTWISQFNRTHRTPFLSPWPFHIGDTHILISLCPSFLFSYVVEIEFSQDTMCLLWSWKLQCLDLSCCLASHKLIWLNRLPFINGVLVLNMGFWWGCVLSSRNCRKE